MIKSQTYQIDMGGEQKQDVVLQYKMLKPSDSLVFLLFLTKMVGGGIGNAVGAIDGEIGSLSDLAEIKDDQISIGKLGEALARMFDRIDEKEVLEKLNTLFKSVSHESNVLDVDYYIFLGRPDLHLKVAATAIGVNYKAFLQENFGGLSKVLKSINTLKNGKSSPEKQA